MYTIFLIHKDFERIYSKTSKSLPKLVFYNAKVNPLPFLSLQFQN